MATKKKKKTGGHRMQALGYKRVTVWFKPDALAALAECAEKQRQSLAEWIRKAAFAENDRQRTAHFYG